MTSNEIITITISTIALVISLLSLYLTFFYKRTGLIAVLVSRNYVIKGKYSNELEYALSNTGNLQLLLKNVDVLIGRLSAGKKTGGYDVSESECSELPLVIEPGHVRLIRLRFMADEIENAKNRKKLCLVSFIIISSHGKKYDILHDLTPLAEPMSDAERDVWSAFKI